ncbi:MAG: DUF4402 domain-containing protein [Lentimicrobiaceae bacterium]|nr:DUF4402 domain-containing protein [Lentimicrobiaceae bacterium]MCO5266987.1 DUF4402 domain-containing protein [Lentimicrobium sp.]
MSKENISRHIARLFTMVLLLLLANQALRAQEDPPKPMQVSTYQHLSFGAFINGNSGGTVTIEPGGNRSVTGDIIPVFLAHQYHPAIFEVEANAGVILSLINGPNVTLSGSNGGTIMLQLGSSLPVSPFINTTRPPFRTQVTVGGTITIGNSLANPPGDYTGEFFVTFVQE